MSDTLPPSSSEPPQSDRVQRIPLARLLPGPNAPENGTSSPALTESIKKHGVLQPLLVRESPRGLEVLAGFKRMAAAKQAGLAQVPVRVLQVEDGDIADLYAASNLQSERRRTATPAATRPPGEYKPAGRLNGLLEEELNRPSHRTPYKSILSLAVAVIFIVWAGLGLSRCRSPRPVTPAEGTVTETSADSTSEQPPAPAATRRPAAVPPPASPRAGPAPQRMNVSDWRAVLADIDGIEIRDLNNIPRIVFLSPVFSRLTTIDPAQQRRLNRVAEAVTSACADCLIVVIGHTDNVPVRPGGAFQSNDHLGELRAQEVVQYLNTRAGIPASRLRPISSGDRDPPFPNTPASNKARNRTVTLEIQPARL